MGFFKKKGPEILDFTSSLGKRVSNSVSSPETTEKTIDFSSSPSSQSSNNSVSSSASPNMDFLSNLAGADNSSSGSVTDSLRTARQKNQMSQELNEMKLKLDDNDFKLNSLVEKVKELEGKVRERGI